MNIDKALYVPNHLRTSKDFDEFVAKIKYGVKAEAAIRQYERSVAANKEAQKNKVFTEMVIDAYAWEKHPLIIQAQESKEFFMFSCAKCEQSSYNKIFYGNYV